MASNYDFTNPVNGNLAITKAHLTVTANDASKTYGDANPLLSSTVSGFVNGQNLANSGVTGTGATTTNATAMTDVGTIAITAGTGSLMASNYDFTNPVNGNLAITKAHLTVTGATATTTYSGAVQTNSFSTLGIKNSNDVVTGVTTLASGTNYSATPYADNLLAATGTGLSNYAITYINGSLAIRQAPLIVYVNDATKVINTTNPVFTSTVSGFQGSDNLVNSTNNIINYSTVANTSSGAGNYLISASGLISKMNNYIINDVDGTLKITASAGNSSPYPQPPSINSQCTKSFVYDNATPRSTC
jgi:choline dehydrogenase-like flavoprotein